MLGTLSSECPKVCGWLLFITGQLIGHDVLTIVDTSATNTFLSDWMVKLLGLRVKYCSNHVKAMNTTSEVVGGRAKWVPFQVGKWKGYLDLTITHLDDYDVILGNDFFGLPSVMVKPQLVGIFIGDPKNPCFMRGF